MVRYCLYAFIVGVVIYVMHLISLGFGQSMFAGVNKIELGTLYFILFYSLHLYDLSQR